LNWSPEKLAEYDRNLAALRKIASRNAGALNLTAKEVERLATMVVQRWDAKDAVPSTIRQPLPTR
jgi:hypothetical protein